MAPRTDSLLAAPQAVGAGGRQGTFQQTGPGGSWPSPKTVPALTTVRAGQLTPLGYVLCRCAALQLRWLALVDDLHDLLALHLLAGGRECWPCQEERKKRWAWVGLIGGSRGGVERRGSGVGYQQHVSCWMWVTQSPAVAAGAASRVR